ncbi:MAG TPA: GNAT family N-acetyltransferase [Rhizomicrobium sp.]|nr:GNAT family N-acetyltransferase [Rhizomicrobium sp.]
MPAIRQARLPADEPAILSFINGLQDYEAAFEPDRRRDPNFAVEHWRALEHRCAEKHGIMLIAEDASGKAVGWAFAHDEKAEVFVVEPERRHGYLAELYVVPQARGQGLGRALIEGCEAWARERGHKVLTVGVLAKNPTAIRAYEGAGFAPYGMTMRRYL